MAPTARTWYRFQNSADDPSIAEIHVIDIIGDWIDEILNEYWGMKATLTAKAFVDQLAQLPDAVKTIKVRINSPGGDVFAALNIANALRDQQLSKGRTVETIVDGLAASAASIIAMAGKTVTMADNALMMVHQPWSIEAGNATNFRAAAATLDTVSKTIVATYQWHSTLDAEALMALLVGKDGVDGTWMSADEAIANGFATDKQEGLQAAASIDPKAAAKLKVPEQFKARVDALLKREAPAPQPAAATEVLAAVAAAGLDTAFASQLVAAQLPLDQVTARIETAKAEKTAADTRARNIRTLCERAHCPELVDSYVASNMTAEAVRAQLAIVTAKIDNIEIDGALSPAAALRVSGAASADITAGWKHAFARAGRTFGRKTH